MPTAKTTYTVSYVVNGGKPSIPNATVSAGTAIAAPTVTKSNNEFDGWFTTSNFSGTQETFPYTVNANTIFYAKWTPTYTVSYVVNGGTPSILSVTVREGTSLPTPTTLTRLNHEFDGWFTTSNFSETKETFPYTINADTTFYAKWTPLYSVSYELNGGTPKIDSVTVRAGTEIDAPTVPTRTGYEFDGWFTISALSGSAVILLYSVNANTTFYAKWTPLYSVSYVINGGTPSIDTAIVRAGTKIDAPTAPTRTGYEFDGWYLNDEFAGGAASFPCTVNADTVFYAKWTPLYSVNYELNGGTPNIDTATVRAGTAVQEPTAPTKLNHAFDGWFKNPTFTGDIESFPYEVNENTTFYAKWTTLYSVSYVLSGGTPSISSVTVRAGTVIEEPTAPTKLNHAFDGWFTTDDFAGAVDPFPYTVNANVIFYAKWTPTYTVSYELNGGAPSIATVTVRAGAAVQTPTTPARTGYVFDGWFTSSTFVGSAVTFPYTVSSDTVFYARWAGEFTVGYVLNGGTPEIESKLVRSGTVLQAPSEPTRTGYVFDGWYADAEFTAAAAFPYAVNADTAFYARWTKTYEVSYVLDGGAPTVPTETVRVGTVVTAPTAPTKTGYIFDGWFTDAEFTAAAVFPHTVDADTAFYAKWTKTYEVSYVLNGGTPTISKETVRVGTVLQAPTAPTKTGYVFSGWYTDTGFTAAAIFPHTVNADTAFYAKWTKTYEVNYVFNDGATETATDILTDGTVIDAPTVPTRTGYVFDGWFTTSNLSGAAAAFPYTVNADTAFYAKWTKTYEVGFVLNNGTPNAPFETVRAGTVVQEPATPTKTGYAFDGWYTTEFFDGSAVSFPYAINADTAFYAKWTELYTVTYVMSGGEPIIAASSVRAGTAVNAPSVPTRSGYEFDGWYTVADFANTAVFPYTVNEDTAFYAKWTALYTVVYVLNGG
ncbi:MAG: InlB B-repeat-containing protein, partial [Clostridiales bacterium]|nr:InlB B-repeat-containing protein [Clostridiales bacterium]